MSESRSQLTVKSKEAYLEGMPVAMPFQCRVAEVEAHCGLGRSLSVKVQGSG